MGDDEFKTVDEIEEKFAAGEYGRNELAKDICSLLVEINDLHDQLREVDDTNELLMKHLEKDPTYIGE